MLALKIISLETIDSFQDIGGIENIVNKEKALEELNISWTDLKNLNLNSSQFFPKTNLAIPTKIRFCLFYLKNQNM